MKRIFAALAVVLSMAWAVPAAAQSFQWGVTGGLNVSKLKVKGDYKGTFSSDNRSGWYFGPKIEISLPLGIGFDGAVEYSQRRLYMPDQTADTYRSLEIPINLRYSLGLGKLASVYIATGPQFGFGVGHTKWGNLANTFDKSNMNTTWNVGAGVKLFKHLEAGVGYNFAVGKLGTALMPSGWMGSSDAVELDYKTNTFQVQVAYLF